MTVTLLKKLTAQSENIMVVVQVTLQIAAGSVFFNHVTLQNCWKL